MLPKNYEPKRSVVIISVIILLTFLIYIIKTTIERKNAFSSGVRYTIGLTTEFYITTSGRNIKYNYTVEGIEYTGKSIYAYDSEVPHGRYWVKFSLEKPEISSIYQNKPIPEGIESVPPVGFKSIPNNAIENTP